MPESGKFTFFDSVIAARAVLLSEGAALRGEGLVSAETQSEFQKGDELSFVTENFPAFIRAIRSLSQEDQQLLFSYYVVGKTQNVLATVYRSTQTLISSRIRAAMQRLACSMNGTPTAETMKPIFEQAGVENLLPVGMSNVVFLYAKTRSFQRVAEVLELNRPDVRREMRAVEVALTESSDPTARALGAFLYGILDKASARGTGLHARQRLKEGHIYIKTPGCCLGSFRVRVEDAGFSQLFSTRANH